MPELQPPLSCPAIPAPPLLLGLAGFGTVGAALAAILEKNKAEILSRTGREIRIKSILTRDPAKPRACPIPLGAHLTTQADDLLLDPEINVLVELIGGADTAGELIRRALESGKNVVTANKALLAERGNAIFSLAAERNLHLGYEAAVCGAIPIIRTLRASLAGNHIESLIGILNGTCNFILSEMSERNLDFAQALREAQRLGYAEADPELDIEGLDAAHKLSLLIRLAWGLEYPYTDMPVQGIAGVAPRDIRNAREFGYRIKLIGYARLGAGESAETGGMEAGVCPALVHENFLLSRVEGPYNAVRVEGNACGSLFLHGKGAGGPPTASSVLADILDIARGDNPNNTGFPLRRQLLPAHPLPDDRCFSPWYIRLTVRDCPGVLRDVSGILADNDISIAEVTQKEDAASPPAAEQGLLDCIPLLIMTHSSSVAGVQKALRALENSSFVQEPPVHYRVLGRSNVGTS
ncbi:MAG: homoserine dehydrogenase [Desulfovibrio sp.]|jgi:homoserine dehydrogenase|nr:homoserine dehydrogenase [Desulfovibrio sp.]